MPLPQSLDAIGTLPASAPMPMSAQTSFGSFGLSGTIGMVPGAASAKASIMQGVQVILKGDVYTKTCAVAFAAGSTSLGKNMPTKEELAAKVGTDAEYFGIMKLNRALLRSLGFTEAHMAQMNCNKPTANYYAGQAYAIGLIAYGIEGFKAFQMGGESLYNKYRTGTLSSDERSALESAILRDQQLQFMIITQRLESGDGVPFLDGPPSSYNIPQQLPSNAYTPQPSVATEAATSSTSAPLAQSTEATTPGQNPQNSGQYQVPVFTTTDSTPQTQATSTMDSPASQPTTPSTYNTPPMTPPAGPAYGTPGSSQFAPPPGTKSVEERGIGGIQTVQNGAQLKADIAAGVNAVLPGDTAAQALAIASACGETGMGKDMPTEQNQKDIGKLGTTSQEIGPMRMSRDMLSRLGYSEEQMASMNTVNGFKLAGESYAKGLKKWGPDGFQVFQRGGATAYENFIKVGGIQGLQGKEKESIVNFNDRYQSMQYTVMTLGIDGDKVPYLNAGQITQTYGTGSLEAAGTNA